MFLPEEQMALLRPRTRPASGTGFRERQRETARRRSMTEDLLEMERRKKAEEARDEEIKAEELRTKFLLVLTPSEDGLYTTSFTSLSIEPVRSLYF